MELTMELIDKGYEIDQQMKKLKPELDKIKQIVADHGYETGEKRVEGFGAFAALAFAKVYNPIDVSTLAATLNERGLSHELFNVLKVDIAALRGVLGAGDIERLQGEETATKISVSFKEVKS